MVIVKMRKTVRPLIFSMLSLAFFFNPPNLYGDEESTALSSVRELAHRLENSLKESTHITRRVAIIDFEDLNTKSQELNLGKVLSEMLTVEILKSGEYEVVERNQLKGVMRELRLGLAGIIDSSSAKEVGRILGADAIIGGSITEVGNFFNISARVIDVETARILIAEEKEIKQDELITVSATFADLRKYPITAGFMSALLPGWGQFYNDEPIKGSLILAVQLASVGSIIYSHYQANGLMESYRKNTPGAVGSYEQAEGWYTLRDALFLTSLGILTYAVGDAIIGAWLYQGDDGIEPEDKLRDAWQSANLKGDLLAEEVLGISKSTSDEPLRKEFDTKEGPEIIGITEYESLKKDPVVGASLSLFPGVVLHGTGNIYAGDIETGLWLLGFEGLSIAMLGLSLGFTDSFPDPSIAIGTLVTGVFLFIGTWIQDIVTTQSVIREHNEDVLRIYEVRVP